MATGGCANEFINREDLATLEDIYRFSDDENDVKNAYIEFRRRKGLPAIEFPAEGSAMTEEQLRLMVCLDSILECFKARKAREANLEEIDFDEVSAYKGTIMAGIGLTKHGRYERKLGDEMGIQKKRPFDNNMHALSKGF